MNIVSLDPLSLWIADIGTMTGEVFERKILIDNLNFIIKQKY